MRLINDSTAVSNFGDCAVDLALKVVYVSVKHCERPRAFAIEIKSFPEDTLGPTVLDEDPLKVSVPLAAGIARAVDGSIGPHDLVHVSSASGRRLIALRQAQHELTGHFTRLQECCLGVIRLQTLV